MILETTLAEAPPLLRGAMAGFRPLLEQALDGYLEQADPADLDRLLERVIATAAALRSDELGHNLVVDQWGATNRWPVLLDDAHVLERVDLEPVEGFVGVRR